MSHAPPPGPPPGHPSRPPQPERRDSLEDAIPDEAPPAYEAVSSDATVQAGPTRMDFSGPPPMPDRLQQQHTQQGMQPTPTGGLPVSGVGYGYGPTSPISTHSQGSSSHLPPPQHPSLSAQHSHSSTSSSQHPPPPGPPPRPQQPQDLTPTKTPTPGRPLLHNNKLLVYPRNHWCSKCQNTGYKNNDPSHPCSSDWRKWGKIYTGALQHSYSTGTTAAENFQRPLPVLHPPQQRPPPPPQQHQQPMGQYPGQYPQYQQQMRPPPPRISTGYGYGRPPGALVLQPGDPRIGGQPCWKCGGSGVEFSLFFFDDTCSACRGIGRVF